MSTVARTSFSAPQLAAGRVHVETWARPVQGTRMPVPAVQLGGIVDMTCAAYATSANAAKGATRKDAAGGGAFEDPV
jgi:hypothetical protein